MNIFVTRNNFEVADSALPKSRGVYSSIEPPPSRRREPDTGDGPSYTSA